MRQKIKSILLPFSLSFIICCVSCDNKDIVIPVTDGVEQGIVNNPHYVPYERALSTAIKYVAGRKQTRAKTLQVKNHYEFVANKTTRSANDTIDVRFHIFNFENNAGFAIVSADNRTTPVYAFSEQGSLDLEEAMSSTGVADFMEGAVEFYKNEVMSVQGPLPLIPSDSIPAFMLSPIVSYHDIDCYAYPTHSSYTSPILTSTTWSQNFPYNAYFPEKESIYPELHGRAEAGCVTIAVAQIIAYNRYPVYYNGINLNWETITDAPYYSHFFALDVVSDSIAQFVYQVALSVDLDFNTSTSNITKARSAFLAWGYSTSPVSSFNGHNIIASIDSGQPVFSCGTNGNNGHSWIIDGYRYDTSKITYYRVTPPHAIEGISTSYSCFYRCNWGWGGQADGWFLEGAFSPLNRSYNNNNKILYGIHPDN